ncbi:uncharacterized protein LOC123315942 [Coccinella septempunctata]|uniref:uncharacterized protein LOC123315942 n=1 Tax=Coccinella septempunctata TaxID=41139 RepID=UPI001D0672F7|nr:uncharacterized protein LOC123315942 [Coccinella septempunctata]
MLHILNLFDMLESLECLYGSKILVFGDFNQPEFCDERNRHGDALFRLDQFAGFFNLEQFNSIHYCSGRLLDLVFSNIDCSVHREFIDQIHLPDNYVLISLDVVSLFSNIPVELALTAIEHRWHSISEHTSIPKDDFLSIVSFLFNANYFIFEGKFFSQILGSPMGSNASSPIAELVMDYLLDCILPSIHFTIPFIKKYVDDLFCSEPRDKTAYILERFNQKHEHIKFALEEEFEMGVPFLDTRVIRNTEGDLRLDWYRKPTHSGSYPKGLLTRLLYNSAPPGQPLGGDGASTNRGEVSSTRYSTIPLIKDVTNPLIKILKHDSVKIVPKNIFKIDRLYSHLKDKIEVNKMSGVVYRVPCSTCEEVYIGQTSQTVKRRITQYISDIKNPDKTCTLADHIRKKDHRMDYGAVEILDFENNTRKRCFLEMFHIKSHNNSMNYRRDIEGVSNIYSYLISLK